MRLIDGDRLLEPRRIGTYYHLPNGDIAIPLIDIEHAPSVDAVQVAGCKDCLFNDGDGPNEDDKYWCALHQSFMQYCSDAERKEE